jgi:Tol biopolymer transport system component
MALLTASGRASDWLIRVRTAGAAYAVRTDGTRVATLKPAFDDLSPTGDLLEKHFDAGTYRIFAARPKGEDRHALAGGEPVLEARWAGDGRHVLYVAVVDGRPQAFRTDPASDASEPLTNDPEGVRDPQQARDGTLVYLALRSTKAREEYRQLPLDERLARKGTLDRVDIMMVRDGRGETVARDLVVHAYGLSPDGRTVAYSTTGRLVIADLDGKHRREFGFAELDPHLTQHAIAPVVWRPDGRALLFRAAFIGGRSAGDGEDVFGDRDCFVLDLASRRVQRFRVETDARVDWTAGEP